MFFVENYISRRCLASSKIFFIVRASTANAFKMKDVNVSVDRNSSEPQKNKIFCRSSARPTERMCVCVCLHSFAWLSPLQHSWTCALGWQWMCVRTCLEYAKRSVHSTEKMLTLTLSNGRGSKRAESIVCCRCFVSFYVFIFFSRRENTQRRWRRRK